jgi:hypothetical protein
MTWLGGTHMLVKALTFAVLVDTVSGWLICLTPAERCDKVASDLEIKHGEVTITFKQLLFQSLMLPAASSSISFPGDSRDTEPEQAAT